MREYRVQLRGRQWVVDGPSFGGMAFDTLTEARRYIAAFENVTLGLADYRDDTLHYRIGEAA